MPKVQYKQKEGALHIGGGRFFYANTPVEVEEEEKEKLLSTYSDLEEVKEPEGKEKYTASSIKQLNADQQKKIINTLGGDVKETSNEEERIALILKLQEEKGK